MAAEPEADEPAPHDELHELRRANLKTARAWLIKEAARLVRNHLEGIVTAVVNGPTTARSEGFNAVIRKIKAGDRGYQTHMDW